MKIALIQMSNGGSMEINLQKSLDYIKEAAENNADLVLFPEVQLTEFFPQNRNRNVEAYKIDINSDIIKKFCESSKQNKIMAVPNVYLSENGKAYDASILISKEGEIIGTQKMVHIAEADKFFEQDYYTESDDGFKVFDTEFGKIGVVVCFDRHYPESIRTEALMGADLILIPTVNTKAEPTEMFEWEIRVQSFQNSVFTAMCNRVGKEGEMDFCGESIVIDQNGDVIVKADDSEQILYAEIDLKKAEVVRKSKPYLGLRRTEFYY